MGAELILALTDFHLLRSPVERHELADLVCGCMPQLASAKEDVGTPRARALICNIGLCRPGHLQVYYAATYLSLLSVVLVSKLEVLPPAH